MRKGAIKRFTQAVEEWDLRFLEFKAGFREFEKAGLVDFGKGLEPSAFRRPLGLKGIALVLMAFGQVAFERPAMNDLATFLLDGAERDESFGPGSDPDFFGELAFGSEQQIIFAVWFTFGNGPVALVLLRKEWPSRMREEDFEFAVGTAKHQ